jgi:hypothetical protein
MEFEKIENAVVAFDASFFTNEANIQGMYALGPHQSSVELPPAHLDHWQSWANLLLSRLDA